MSDDNKRPTNARLYDKLDKIDSRLSSIDITLAKQHMSLEEHMRRTKLLEAEMKPVTKHVEQVRGAGMLIALLSLIATIASLYVVFR